jgi:hypothetical protein
MLKLDIRQCKPVNYAYPGLPKPIFAAIFAANQQERKPALLPNGNILANRQE